MIPKIVKERIVLPYFSLFPEKEASVLEENKLLFHFSRVLLLDDVLDFSPAKSVINGNPEYYYFGGADYVQKLVAQIRNIFFEEFHLNYVSDESLAHSLPVGVFLKSWEQSPSKDVFVHRHYVLYGILYGFSLKTLSSYVAIKIKNKEIV